MSAVVRLLGAAPVAGAWRLLTRGRLRAVTYHGVADTTAFAAQLDWLGERFTTVTAGQVADALHGGAALPPRPVWLTFDDGDITVVRNALPLLRERNMVATAFLCGAWLDSAQLPWWVTLESAQRQNLVQLADTGHTDSLAVRLAVKRMSDAQRRAVIAALGTKSCSKVLLGERHTHRRRKSLAQGSCRHFDTGHVPVLRVTGGGGAQLAERLKILEFRSEAAQVQHRIQQHRGMTSRQHKSVTVEPGRL